MTFGYADIESPSRHFLHEHVHRAAGRHGGRDAHNIRIEFRQFHQRISEHILKERRHTVGIADQAFSGCRIEFAGRVPFGGMLLRRSEPFAFNGMQMQYLRAAHVFDIMQHPCQILHVMPVYGPEVADVHSFEYVLLAGGYRFETVAEADQRFAPFLVQYAYFRQSLRGLEPQPVVRAGSGEVEQILFHPADAAVDRHIVVVQYDKQIVGCARRIVQPLESQSSAHRTVTEDGHHMAVVFSFLGCRHSHAQSRRNGIRSMPAGESIVFALLR